MSGGPVHCMVWSYNRVRIIRILGELHGGYYGVMLVRLTTLVLVCALVSPTPGCSSATTPGQPEGAPAASSPSAAAAGETPPADATPALAAYTEAEVQALFDARCVKCHGPTSANVDLSEPFTERTVGVESGAPTGKTLCGRGGAVAVRIKAGDRKASLLWHKVKGTQDCGSPMPYDRGNKPLDAEELERLGLYIDQLER